MPTDENNVSTNYREYDTDFQDREDSQVLSIDTNTPPTVQNQETDLLILEAYRWLHKGELGKAIANIRNARVQDMGNVQLRLFYQQITNWATYIEQVNNIPNFIDKGDFFVEKWTEFEEQQQKLIAQENFPYSEEMILSKESTSNLKVFVIGLAYRCYQHALTLNASLNNSLSFKLKQYQCLKQLEEYEPALALIQEIYREHGSSKPEIYTEIYTELADAYYLTNNIALAKLLFREIFSSNPLQVNLESIQAPFIHTIFKEIMQYDQFSTRYIKNWIPVFGYLMNIFHVTREITAPELHVLENNIATIEAKLEDHRALGHDDINVLLPELLNKYFWLIEHYIRISDPNTDLNNQKYFSKINIIYQKIHQYHPWVYQKLLKMKEPL